jgi:hypothetical protein
MEAAGIDSGKKGAITVEVAHLARRVAAGAGPFRPHVAALARICEQAGWPSELLLWAELEEGLADLEAGLDPIFAPQLRGVRPEPAVREAAVSFLSGMVVEEPVPVPPWIPPKQLDPRLSELPPRRRRRASANRVSLDQIEFNFVEAIRLV